MASFNQKMLNDNFGDDKEILSELIEIFFQEVPKMLKNIRDSIDSKDCDDLRLHAHTLKGAVSNFFADKCVEHSFALESMGRDGEVNIEVANSLFSLLEAELEVLSKDLNDFVK